MRPSARFCLLVWMVLLPAPCCLFAQTSSDSDLQIMGRLAEERYAEGDLARAAVLYQQIADRQSDPSAQARARLTAAWLLHLDGDRTQPLELMTKALRVDPQLPFDPALYDRPFEILYRQALEAATRERQQTARDKTEIAVRHLQADRTAEARALLSEALELDPDNPTALYNLAVIELRSGAASQAILDFERVVALTHRQASAESLRLRARAQVAIGQIYLQQDREGDAEQAFLEATGTDPGEGSAWLSLGRLLYRQERFTAAIDPLQRARDLLPEDRGVTRALAHCLLETGQLVDASSTLADYLQRHPDDAESWQQLARIESERGEHEAAIRAWELSIVADSGNESGIAITSATEMADFHLRQGQPEQALTRANEALGWDRSHARAWFLLGRAQMMTDQLQAAVASLGRAAELAADSAEYQTTYGQALAASRQYPLAEAAFLRALSLAPDATEASAGLDEVRGQLASERAIVAGRARPRKPIPPKKIGLEFAGIDYKDLALRGALVKQVKHKSPAARAGLRKGDLLLWIGDYAVISDKDFLQYLKRNPPADSMAIEYLRDGRIEEAEIRLR